MVLFGHDGVGSAHRHAALLCSHREMRIQNSVGDYAVLNNCLDPRGHISVFLVVSTLGYNRGPPAANAGKLGLGGGGGPFAAIPFPRQSCHRGLASLRLGYVVPSGPHIVDIL